MARRQRTLVDKVADALWWVSPIVAGIVYLFLRYGLPMLASDPARQAAFARIAEEAWLIALLLLVPMPFAAIAAWQRRQRRRGQRILAARKRPVAPGAGTPPAPGPGEELMGALIRLCPRCGSKMVVRTLASGPQAGQKVWGCAAFPRCRAMEPYGDE